MSCWRSTRSIWSITTRACSTKIVADFKARARSSVSRRSRRSRFRRGTATTCHGPVRAPCAWYQGPALLELSRNHRCRGQARRAAVPLAGAMGQPAQSRFPRLCGHARDRPHRAGRRDRRRRFRQHTTRRAHRHHGWRSRAAPRPATRSRWCSPTRSTSRAAMSCAIPPTGPQVADQFAATSDLDERGQPAAGPVLSAQMRRQRLPASVTEIKYQLDVETLANIAAKTLSLNEVGFCNLSLSAADRLRSLSRQPRHRRASS